MYAGNHEGVCYTGPFTLAPNPAGKAMNQRATAPPIKLPLPGLYSAAAAAHHHHYPTTAAAQEQYPS